MAIKTFLTPLDNTDKVNEQYLPSYVDDVVEYANRASFPAAGETGKIYVAIDTSSMYRWTGSTYTSVGGSGGSSSFDLSDRLAKGVDANGNPVVGAVVEGALGEIENAATGEYSHAGGKGTVAAGESQTAIGKYNQEQGNDVLFVIGNGTSSSDRSDAFAIKSDGTLVFANGAEITPEQFFTMKNKMTTGPSIYTVSIPANDWTQDTETNWYTQTLTVVGITAESHPRATIVYPDHVTEEDKITIDEGAAALVSMITGDDTIVFYAVKNPGVGLTLELIEN